MTLKESGISIHAPREGCDRVSPVPIVYPVQFQSTHPARGATSEGTPSIVVGWYFNPRTPRGVRRAGGSGCPAEGYFNPRTPRGVRLDPLYLMFEGDLFQSTHPARGATLGLSLQTSNILISIHAPREGCDLSGSIGVSSWVNFNPRTPRGVRQQTLPKSREFAWLNLLICTRGRRLSIQKQTRLCSIKLSFMLFGCEPAGEGVSSWTSHATKSKVRLEGRSA